ncbi:hypothetical protein [Bradyrhizobium sp. McL0615]|uniref:hypothetical protein n=1 Tax=Bradyrhizobium sp. McL0615 TaxID=3415673 RepID=UPI003CE8265E
MKLATLALASVFALSSTFALAATRHHYTSHHKYTSSHKYRTSARPYQGTVGMGGGSYGQYYGNPNNRGGLVGGADPGTYRP